MNGYRKPASPPAQIAAQSQPRNIVTPQRGHTVTPPSYTRPGEEPGYSQVYPQQSGVSQYSVQPPSIGLAGQQSYDISKQTFSAPRMPNPGVAPQQAPNMYQQPQAGMRTQQPPFYATPQANMRPQRYPTLTNQQQTNQAINPSLYYVQQQPGMQIIMQPNNMMPFGQRMPTPQFSPITQQPNLYQMQDQQSMPPRMSYPNQATQFGNPITYFNTPTQSQRPPSAGGIPTTQSQPAKRERHPIQIVDPNTGKDISAELSTNPARATPPGGASSGSGSRSTPVSGILSQSPQNEIAAQFAAQVAAVLSHPEDAHRAPVVQNPSVLQPMPPPGALVPQSSHVALEPTMMQQPPPTHVLPQMDGNVPQVVSPPINVGPPGPQLQPDAEPPVVPSMLVQPLMPIMDPQLPMEGSMAPSNVNTAAVHTEPTRIQARPQQTIPQYTPHSLSKDPSPVVQNMRASSEPVPDLHVSHTSESKVYESQSGSVDSIDRVDSGASEPLSSHKPIPPHEVAPPQKEPVAVSIASKPTPPVVQTQRSVTVSIENAVPAHIDTRTSSEKAVEQPPAVQEVQRESPAIVERESTPVVQRESTPVVQRESTPEEEVNVCVQDVNVEAPDVLAEVNTVPEEVKEPSPEVVKQPVIEAPPPDVEPVKELAPVKDGKKDKGKKKFKELNKKGDNLKGSDMDAFTTDEPAQVKVEQAPVEPAPVEQKPSPVTPPEPEVAVEPEPQKEASPEMEDKTPKVEIKIEDSEVVAENEKNEAKNDEEVKEPEPSLPELKYKYKEDQWSPLNTEGKKQYDRDFLLQLQFAQESVSKPMGLPEIPDIILDKPHNPGMRSFSRDFMDNLKSSSEHPDFMPRYVWDNRGGSGGGGRPALPRRRSDQKGPRDKGSSQKIISLSVQKDIELHHAEKAWKPSHNKAAREDEVEDPKTEELYKKTRMILNKLTPQKFQTLLAQMQALQIDSEKRLKGVIDLVFEKAISEPAFSVAYANMCRCLSMFKVPSETKPGEMVNFRAILLTRCQREFEKDKSQEIDFEAKRKEIEEATEKDKIAELKEELEYAESKAKRRSLGNIRFIGELFKLKMLTENIMHDCVFKLLRTKDPENLECLCRLLTTIGRELDTDKAKPRMDQYFNQMLKIFNEKKTSSRVRFMLQDVIDLRKSKWVPRRDDSNPKTIDQIHRDVAKEEQERQLLVQQLKLQQITPGKGGPGRRPGPPGAGGPMGQGPDGWNTVGAPRPMRQADRSIDPSKLKLSKQNVDEGSIQLGPGGGAGRFAGWARGSSGGGSRQSQEGEKSSAPANRFSALSRPEDESGRRGFTSPARGDSRGRGGFGRPPNLSARASQESEREKAIAAAKTLTGRSSMENRRESSREKVEKPVEKPAAPVAPTKELTREEMEKKTTAIVDEYLHLQDIKEALLCVKELNSPSTLHLFVSNALNQVLERSDVARKQTGHLLHDLVKNKLITVDQYVHGLTDILEFAEDMEIDIPKIWQYLGELIGPMVQDGSVPLSFLKTACELLKASNKAGILVAKVLHDASHREGHKKVGELWRSSGLKWTDFVPKNQLDEFLAEQKLEYTKGGDSAPTTPTTGASMKRIQEELDDLLGRQKADNEAVFDWIEENVDDPTTKRFPFIRTLMTSVCESAIAGEGNSAKVDQKEIKRRNDLLQKYLDHQAEFELQALYALQALVHRLEHPPGVLRQLFDTLYDEDIISEDAFIQWEKSDDPKEQEGKGVAMKQVVQFFTWLKEAEDEVDS